MRFNGHYRGDLPIKEGDKIVIPAGVVVHTFQPRALSSPNSRRRRVRIDHTICGSSLKIMHMIADHERGRFPGFQLHFAAFDALRRTYETATESDVRLTLYRKLAQMSIPVSNPAVRWAGSGGYWCWVDINDVLEANGL